MRPLVANLIIVLAALPAVAGTGVQRPPGIVLAVDTSRSLHPAEVARVTSLLADTVERLPADSPVALLAFDNTPRWIAPLGGPRAGVRRELARLEPNGRFTLLYDALFAAARALPDGGAIVLATDGHDENSATTVDDVASLCRENHVRIIAIGVGQRIDDRSLRRLALLTSGAYLGRAGPGLPETLLRSVGQASEEVAREVGSGQAPPAREQAPPAPPAPPPASPSRVGAFVLLATGLVLVGLVLGVGLWLHQRAEERRQRFCERCGAPLDEWETECTRCGLPEVHALGREQEAATPQDAEEASLDPDVFAKLPLEEALDKTFVLDEQAVVVVREPKRSPRTYVLPFDKAFAVGRAKAPNTVCINDPTISAQHFRIVHKDGAFYLVDLDSTNGTLLNGERVRARKLHAGDVIRAGAVELEFRTQYRPQG